MATTAPGRWRLRAEVAVGGAVGTLLRVGVVAAVATLGADGPVLGLLGANLAGAFLLGWLTARSAIDARAARWLSPVGGGLLGGLTTFSALASQLAFRLDGGEVAAAVALAAVSVLGGVLAARVGLGSGGHRVRGARPDRQPPS